MISEKTRRFKEVWTKNKLDKDSELRYVEQKREIKNNKNKNRTKENTQKWKIKVFQ